MTTNSKLTIENLRSPIAPTWCPGCQNYILSAGLQQALANLSLPKENIVVVYDIGCIGNAADLFSLYGIHSLHGRCVPTAIGVKLANPKLTVIALGGDGGIYGEGLNHLLSAARLDIDITTIVSNNHIYSLTTGQTSPTTARGLRTKSTPGGAPSVPIDPVSLVKSVNSQVFARQSDCTDPSKVADIIKEAILFPKFALLDFTQICITFGKKLSP